ncbi:MAG: DUF1841 family protein [Gammaproteobacteria bacterium]|nr:MAG: DUF1841 family protein [Gammaproteobacteria bacterium]
MYSNHREAYRQAFFIAWQKWQKKLPLEAVEAQLVEIIIQHPEYHALLEKPEAYQYQEFSLEENPFFHMSLHLAIREQIHTNRPAGIAQLYQQLIQTSQPHEVEHSMMTCLAQVMQAAQQSGEMPEEEEYLEKLKLI